VRGFNSRNVSACDKELKPGHQSQICLRNKAVTNARIGPPADVVFET